jgi:hypothetical protein
MRSALDNLVCGLIRTKDRGCKCAGTKFPICRTSEAWDKSWKADLKGAPAEAQSLIKGLQPYNRPSSSVDIDPLSILNALSNRDKHRAANLTTGYSRNTRFAIHSNNGTVEYVTVDRFLYGEGGPEIIPLSVKPSAIQPSARVEAMGTGVLAFRDGDGPWGERAVGDVILTCLRYVEDSVVARFRPFFGG